jgi:ParB family chromosome partitioning protein
MAKRPTLGRGLAALLAETGETEADLAIHHVPHSEEDDSGPGRAEFRDADLPKQGVVDLPIASIRRNPRQPRRVFDPEALKELATSINSVGIVQPIIVRCADDGYELIAGERRWRACQMAGYTVIPAIIRNASDVESLELALVENVVRQQLNPVDEAYALKVLLDDLGVTQDNLAARVGRSRSAIANKIRLLELPSEIQDDLAQGVITEGHGRALLGLTERGRQLRLARRVVEKGLSVRQVEDEVRRLGSQGAAGQRPQAEPGIAEDNLDELNQLVYSLVGIMPRVKTKGSGGSIEISFQSREEFDQIIERLKGLMD